MQGCAAREKIILIGIFMTYRKQGKEVAAPRLPVLFAFP